MNAFGRTFCCGKSVGKDARSLNDILIRGGNLQMTPRHLQKIQSFRIRGINCMPHLFILAHKLKNPHIVCDDQGMQSSVLWSISNSHSHQGASSVISSLLLNCGLSSLAKVPNQCLTIIIPEKRLGERAITYLQLKWLQWSQGV